MFEINCRRTASLNVVWTAACGAPLIALNRDSSNEQNNNDTACRFTCEGLHQIVISGLAAMCKAGC